MTTPDMHPPGAPCWVDTFQPDPRAALDFYGPLFGWRFERSAETPDSLAGDYFDARLDGRLATGIGQAPPGVPAVWTTYVRVEDADRTLARAERAGGGRLHGPIDLGSEGRLAVLTDATGVPFGLWQPGRRLGAEVVREPNAWAMSSLHSTDVQRAERFYGEVFGWQLEPVPEAPFSQWRLSDRLVGVVTVTDGIAVPPHWSVNFAVRDADAIAERAIGLGGTIVMAPMDTPGFRSAVIADPQGGVVAVSAARD